MIDDDAKVPLWMTLIVMIACFLCTIEPCEHCDQLEMAAK
jgi:hypothetical protein